MMERLLNAPFKIQATLAWALLWLMVLAITAVVWSITDSFLDRLAVLVATREHAGALSDIANTDLALLPDPTSIIDGSRMFIDAPSLGIGRANLQQRVADLAVEADVTIISASNLADLVENGAMMIGLNVEMSGEHDNVVRMVHALESSLPPLSITELNMRVMGEELPVEQSRLQVQLHLYGAVRAAKKELDPSEGEPQ